MKKAVVMALSVDGVEGGGGRVVVRRMGVEGGEEEEETSFNNQQYTDQYCSRAAQRREKIQWCTCYR